MMKKSLNDVKILSIAALSSLATFGVANQTQAAEMPTLGDSSSFTIKQGSKTDYTFTSSDGNNISYYKIELSKNLSTSESLTWEEVSDAGDNTVSVHIPHNGSDTTKYYKYTYSIPSGYTTNSNRVTDLTSENLTNVVFKDSGETVINNNENLSSIDVIADFVNNQYSDTRNHYSNVYGGLIFNNAELGNIKGDFIKNTPNSGADCRGGAIFNDQGTIADITGDFIQNGISAYDNYYAYGGAIYNSGTIGNIKGNFVENYVTSNFRANFANYGGAIYNKDNIGDITGDFIGNYATASRLFTDNIYGGAIYNKGTIRDITGDFIGNYVSENDVYDNGAMYDVYGGAIYNIGTIGNITGDFIGNYATTSRSESVNTYGGAIYNEGTIRDITGDFIGNYVSGDYAYGGAIYNKGTIRDITGDFIANLTLKNSNILNNHAEVTAEDGEALGGAIYNSGTTIKILADNGKTSLISGNYTKIGNKIDDNAIFMDGGELIFDVTNGSTIQLDDNINGNYYSTYIIGDKTSKFLLNNKIKNSSTHLMETNLLLTKDSNLNGNNLTLHSGTLSMINNQVGVSALNNLTVTGNTNVLVDVDLANKTMDRFTASEYGSHSGNLNVAGMNLLSDAVSDTTEIYFAERGLKDNVTYGGGKLPNSNYQTTLYTPIYKYNATYDNRDDAGYFVFTRGNNGGSTPSNPPVENFNPAIIGSSTSATVGAIGTMNQTFNYAFQNSADFMNLPYLERISMRNANKYALSITGDATDVGRFSPLYQPNDEEASVWVKPYATFETVGLKNGPKVHNNTYGTLIGFDSEMQHLKHGWDRVFTGYLGYNGASQRYSSVDSTQNGGLIGGTITMYKGNFFNATTLSVGASVSENTNMYGKEDFTMLLGGIGNKTGYNFEFKEGKFILQPSMLMSYTFVNTFDYTNSAGVRIDNKPLHALQLAPGVKVIGNLKHSWQPYASVSMVWNLMGESDARANGVKLPEMSIKPYVQYGVGVQKHIKEHFMAYGQAMIQNGGRNGISLTCGFRWALGHNCKVDKVQKIKDQTQKVQKVQNENIIKSTQKTAQILTPTNTKIEGTNGTKKILKQMSMEQKARLSSKYANTSRTAKAGILRQY